MKHEHLSEIIEQLDSELIEEAATYTKRATPLPFKKWMPFAASFLVLVIVGTVVGLGVGQQTETPSEPEDTSAGSTEGSAATSSTTPQTPTSTANGENTGNTSPTESNKPSATESKPTTTNKPATDSGGRYKGYSSEAAALIWPWEYKTTAERYTQVIADGVTYNTQGKAISPALLGQRIGTGEAKGQDIYEKKDYTVACEVYAIQHVASTHRVAVKIGDEYLVFSRDKEMPPATFGDMLDAYGLMQTVSFGQFADKTGYDTNAYFALNDGALLWPYLQSCRDAAIAEEGFAFFADRTYLSFTVSSEAIGAYKHALYISTDGYLWSNLADYGYLFHIGKEKADALIRYARQHSREVTEPEPFQYYLIGTVTEIHDDYVLIDDTAACINEADGRVFKVMLDDIRIKRCFAFGATHLQVGKGSTVCIQSSEPIDLTGNTPVYGATNAFGITLMKDGTWIAPA